METFAQDFKFAFRTLVKSPGFAAVAVLSLALGIGANTTIFTVINALFLNPLPVERPAELVSINTVDENNPGLNPISFENYKDFRDQNDVFAGVASYGFPTPVSFSTDGEPEQIFVEIATWNYFEVLGLKPALGRFFLPEEDEAPGRDPVAVLSHGFWTRRLGADPKVVGSTIELNAIAYDVVGIAPEGFRSVSALFAPDLWVPTMMYTRVWPAQFRSWFDDRRFLGMNAHARLKPGVTIEQARANIKTIARALEEAYPEPNEGRTAELIPLVEATIFPGFRDMAVLGGTILMVIVGLVLLIACFNVANLMLAKASARRREVAIRLSMGAGRGRLIRQLLTESTILSLLGGALGLVIALWGRDFIAAFRPPQLQQLSLDLKLDATVLFFTLAVALVAGIVFGLAPALHSSRANVVNALKEETRTAGRSRTLDLRSVLVVGQVALSIVSLIAAGLFLRSLLSAYEIDPGFETERLAVVTLSPGQAGYDQPRGEQLYDRALERVRSLPGVRAATIADNAPLLGGFARSVLIEGRKAEQKGAGVLVNTMRIELDYFDTTGISLTRGRDFTSADREDSVPVAIINEFMAERFWPGEDAIGKRFRFYGDEAFHEVVGIAATAKYTTLGEDPKSFVYTPFRQQYADTMTLHVRSEGDAAPVLVAVQREIRSLDSEVPFLNPSTMPEVIDISLTGAKLWAALLGVMGVLALTLASIGLYGVMAYVVHQRSHEIGLRMALGASQPNVLGMVLRQAMKLVGVGIVIGMVAAFAVSQMVQTLLFEISAADPVAFIGVPVVLLLVSFLASFLPAHRASRVDPLIALRHE